LKTARVLRCAAFAANLLLLMLKSAHGEQLRCFEIRPSRAAIGENVQIELRGLTPGQPVLLRLCATNLFGRTWESHAEFLTDGRGRVVVANQAPRSGTYRHPDAAGLFWSLARPANNKSVTQSNGESLNPADFQLTAEVQGKVLATARLTRLFIAPGVKRIAVRDGPLRGTLFLPAGRGSHPGVLVLGGSEGGLHELNAAFLASKGYAALALAYFGFEDLPKSFENIPLEYFEAAIEWLGARKDVRPDQIAAMGASRGGELALLLGSTFPKIKAVVAFAPSGIVWPGIGREGVDEAAWTFHGRSVPFLTSRDYTSEQNQEMERILSHQPIDFRKLFLLSLDNKAAVEKATIPVQKINGPVLLISGQDDRVWPSTLLCNRVVDQLKQAKHPFPDCQLVYPGAGHFIPIPNLPATVNVIIHPVTKTQIDLGGDPEHTARASVDSWAHILKFLHAALSQSPRLRTPKGDALM
jgi:pimeloyl-ACP methyl ester carboxylesterase